MLYLCTAISLHIRCTIYLKLLVLVVAQKPKNMDAGLRRSRAWVQIAALMLSGNSIRQTVHTHHAAVHQGADLHMAQLMPLPLTVSCFSKIQIDFTFLIPAYPGSPGKMAVKRVCVCVCVVI